MQTEQAGRRQQTATHKQNVLFTAKDDFRTAVIKDQCEVALDEHNQITLQAAVTKDFTLTINHWNSGDLDRWQEKFLQKVQDITGQPVQFDCVKCIVTSGDLTITLPFEQSSAFTVNSKTKGNGDITYALATRQSVSIFTAYLETLSKELRGQGLEGSFAPPSKLDVIGDRLTDGFLEAGRQIYSAAETIAADLSKTPFGKAVTDRFKQAAKRATGQLLDLERLQYKPTETITFESIFGQDKPVQELKNLALILNSRATAEDKRMASPSLMILTGGPGLGKTRSMDAFMQASGSPAYVLSGDTLMNQWYGNTERMTMQLLAQLEEAAKTSPTGVAILKVDEAESKLKARGPDTHEASSRMLSIFLENITPNSGVLILFATNIPEALDPAIISRTTKVLGYSPLSPKTLTQALLYRLDQLPINEPGYAPSRVIDARTITKMFPDGTDQEDGRVIDRVLKRIYNLKVMSEQIYHSEGEKFQITQEVLIDAIEWAINPAD